MKLWQRFFEKFIEPHVDIEEGIYIKKYLKTKDKKHLTRFYSQQKYTKGYEKPDPEWLEKFDIILKLANIKENEKVLDIGCSTRMLEPYIKKLGAKYIGLDASKDFKPDILTDAEDLSMIKDNSYDLAIAADVIEHLPNPKKALNEIYRVSKRAIISVPNLHSFDSVPFIPKYPYDRHLIKKTPFGWLRLFKQANFKIEKISGANYAPHIIIYPVFPFKQIDKIFRIKTFTKLSKFINKSLADKFLFKYIGQELVVLLKK